MDDNEYLEIEERALAIVATLDELAKEIEQLRDARIDTDKSLSALNTLLESVSGSTTELANTAKAVQQCDYVGFYDKLKIASQELTESSSKVSQSIQAGCDYITQTEARIQASFDEATRRHEQLQSEFDKKIQLTLDDRVARLEENNTELLTRIIELENIIARIDRNTQKGFNKEKSL